MIRSLILACLLAFATAIKIPFRKQKYTPLVFFKVPPGILPESDALELSVRELEKELGVRVERLDILRDPAAEAVLAMLTQKSPPFLYHRESCQVIHMPPKSGKSDQDMPMVIDKTRLRAWAKGRVVPSARATAKVSTPLVLSGEDNSISQEELLEDMTLTPNQRKGKKMMEER